MPFVITGMHYILHKLFHYKNCFSWGCASIKRLLVPFMAVGTKIIGVLLAQNFLSPSRGVALMEDFQSTGSTVLESRVVSA